MNTDRKNEVTDNTVESDETAQESTQDQSEILKVKTDLRAGKELDPAC